MMTFDAMIPNIQHLILNRNYNEAAKQLLRYGTIDADQSEEDPENRSRYQAFELDNQLWKLVKRNGQVIHLSN